MIVILRTSIAGDNGCGLVELMGIIHGDYTRIKPASRNIQIPPNTLYVTARTRPDPDFIVDILRKTGWKKWIFSKCIEPPIRIQFGTRVDRQMQLEWKKTFKTPPRKVYSTVMSGSLRSRDWAFGPRSQNDHQSDTTLPICHPGGLICPDDTY